MVGREKNNKIQIEISISNLVFGTISKKCELKFISKRKKAWNVTFDRFRREEIKLAGSF